MNALNKFLCVAALACGPTLRLAADAEVYLLDVPDYHWHAGCFGTACGNLMGYWDRHGLPDFYTGPTAGGVAPLNDSGANNGIRALWASQAGVDGRPTDRRGHMDDYYDNYEWTLVDRYARSNWVEHPPDCIGDFIGLSQRKWTNMNGECDGNIDAYSFVYWDATGNRRVNYTPSADAGQPARDIQSGLRAWARWRGYDADVFTQLADFNPQTPAGKGFTYEDVKAEINAGYPVMVFLQNYSQLSRPLSGMPRANPVIHGMTIYGYEEYPDYGIRWVRVRTSWASGDGFPPPPWDATPWVSEPSSGVYLSVRGVIGFRPHPKIRTISRAGNSVTLTWDGPSSQLYDALNGTTTAVHRYVVERATTPNATTWTRVAPPSPNRALTFADCCDGAAFYRVRLLHPGE
jgi:hypothetical protein